MGVLKRIFSALFGEKASKNSPNIEYYKILGVKPNVTLETVRTAYKEQSERLNADLENFSHDSRLKQRMEELIRELDEAYRKVLAEQNGISSE